MGIGSPRAAGYGARLCDALHIQARSMLWRSPSTWRRREQTHDLARLSFGTTLFLGLPQCLDWPLPASQATPRAGVRADQTGPRVPPVPDARLREGARRVGHHLQHSQSPEAATEAESVRGVIDGRRGRIKVPNTLSFRAADALQPL